MADQLADGSKFRTLTIVDVFTKEALAIEVGQRLRGEHVVSALNHIAVRRGVPRHLFVDNGSEFSGRLLDMWAYHYRAKIDFSRPGKPTDNCHIETFNGSFRDECLNLHWFETLGEARRLSRRGAGITTRAVLTLLSKSWHQPNSPVGWCFHRVQPNPKRRKTRSRSGPEIPSGSRSTFW